MARTVAEVTDSIDASNSTLQLQEGLVKRYSRQVQELTDEIEALQKQFETLEATQLEFDELCGTLNNNAIAIGNNYGSTNGFANDFSVKATEKIGAIKEAALKKLQDMIDRIDFRMGDCRSKLSEAQGNLNDAQYQINLAKNELESYYRELEQAEAEENSIPPLAGIGVQ